MNYEQFFTIDNYNCYSQIKIAVIGIACLSLLADCVYSCRERNKLNLENKTLKNIISKSIERTIIRNLKNGNDLVDSDEE